MSATELMGHQSTLSEATVRIMMPISSWIPSQIQSGKRSLVIQLACCLGETGTEPAAVLLKKASSLFFNFTHLGMVLGLTSILQTVFSPYSCKSIET